MADLAKIYSNERRKDLDELERQFKQNLEDLKGTCSCCDFSNDILTEFFKKENITPEDEKAVNEKLAEQIRYIKKNHPQ